MGQPNTRSFRGGGGCTKRKGRIAHTSTWWGRQYLVGSWAVLSLMVQGPEALAVELATPQPEAEIVHENNEVSSAATFDHVRARELFAFTTTTLQLALAAYCEDPAAAAATYGAIETWDTSGVTEMSYLISEHCISLTIVEYYYYYAYEIGYVVFNADITAWDTSSVRTMEGMFYKAKAFNQAVGASWDVSHVTTMRFMFSYASIFNQALDFWDVGSVTSMNNEFSFASTFNQALGSWDVGRVTTMESMFSGATKFNKVVEFWDVCKVTAMGSMFNKAVMFNQALDSWDVNRVVMMDYMFNEASAFNQALGSWNVGRVTTMSSMFNKAYLFNQALDYWDVSRVVSIDSMFAYCFSFNQALNSWNVSTVTSMGSTFSRAKAFNQALDSWDVSIVTNMYSMFYAAETFNQDLSPWDVRKADIRLMFNNANSFRQGLCWFVAPGDSMFTGSLGYISTDVTSAACQCEEGSYSPNGAKKFTGGTRCTPCPAGTFSAIAGTAGACNSCAPGKASSSVGATDSNVCSTCPNGTASDLARTSCVASGSCPAGSMEDNMACTPCSKGHYGTGALSSCLACPAGTFATSLGSTECTSCGSGQYTSAPGGDACTSCAPGSFVSAVGASSCTLCNAGSFSTQPGADTCLSCAVERVAPVGAVTCLSECPAGFFKAASSCIGCPDGKMSPAGSAACTSSCPAGNYMQRLAECWPCPSGKYSAVNNTASSCVACTPGKVSSDGATLCVFAHNTTSLQQAVTAWCNNPELEAATFGDITTWDTSGVESMNSLFFTYCSPANARLQFNQALDTWDVSSVTSMDSMFASASKFNQALDSWDVSRVVTMHRMFNNAAMFNQALDSWNVRSVTNMQLMFASASKFNQALDSWDVSRVVTMYQMFYYAAVFDQALCWDLAGINDTTEMFFNSLGSVTKSVGAESCQCPAGQFSISGSKFSSAGIATPCTACEPGKYSSAKSKTCDACAEGLVSYRGAGRVDDCFSCPAGTGWSSGSESCETCAAGSYGPNSEAKLGPCALCAAGSYGASSGSSECTFCGHGKASTTTGAMSSAVCMACSIPAEVSVADFSSCIGAGFCPAGTFEDSALATCIFCSAGRFMAVASIFDGASACRRCDAGKSSQTGSQYCESCSAGKASTSGGLCTDCSPGTYAGPGKPACANCAPGKASAIMASTSETGCEVCSSGRASAAGSSSCTTCGAGKFAGDENTTMENAMTLLTEGASLCNPCPAGYFSANQGAFVCLGCASGKVAATAGLSLCTPCAAGTYSATASTCTDCNAGKYAASTGKEVCNDCPGDTHSAGGATSCDLCDKSFYRSDDAEKPCIACPDHALCLGESFLPAPRDRFWSYTAPGSLGADIYRCPRKTCTGALDGVGELRKECWTAEAFDSKLCKYDNGPDSILCEPGSHGPLCGSCLPNYYYSALSGTCKDCAAEVWTKKESVAAGVVLAGALISHLAAGRIPIPSAIKNSWLAGLVRKVDSGSLKVIFSTYQIVQSITVTLDVTFPPIFSSMLEFMSFLSFNVSTLDCSTWGHVHSTVYFVSSVPVVVALVIVAVGAVRFLRISSTKQRSHVVDQHAWALLLLSYLVLPPVMTKQLQALDCIELDFDGGHSFLRVDTTIDCASPEHLRFAIVDTALICLYLLIPVAWVFLLEQVKLQLIPPSVENPAHVIHLRNHNEKLSSLQFLFKDYRPSLYYFEVVDMYRRIVFCGVISVCTTNTLKRGLIGCLLSLASMVVYREVMPFQVPIASTLAHLAQIVIFLTFGAAVVIEVGFGDDFNPLAFGAVLCVINVVVVGVALAASLDRHRREQRELRRKQEVQVQHVEWACNFSANKFNTTFDAVIESSVPPSHTLVFHYMSLAESKKALRSGVKVSPREKGILVTLHRFHDLTEEDMTAFPCREAFLALSMPKRLLFPVSGSAAAAAEGSSAMRLVPSRALEAMRGTFFGDLVDSKPWTEGHVLLPPQCIKRAYRIAENPSGAFDQSSNSTDADDVEMAAISARIEMTEDKGRAPVEHIKVLSSCKELLDATEEIRAYCAKRGNLVPLNHFTSPSIVQSILMGGFRMSTQGQGDGGVYFSTQGPCSYEVGSPDYETNLIRDCFGSERLAEYLGRHKLDALMVYGVEPWVLQQAPGGRDNAKMVSKRMFEDFSLPHADGCYYLRPDRILGCFLLDPANPLRGSSAVADRMDNEKMSCEVTKVELAALEKDLASNELMAQSVYASATTKVEWACGFSANKFKTTFDAVIESSVPPSHMLVFFYSSLTEVHKVLRSGIPANARRGGVIFTVNPPHDLSKADQLEFPCREAFVACALPRRLLHQWRAEEDDASELRRNATAAATSFRVLSVRVLQAMRGAFFGEVVDPGPWIAGRVLLPPQCIKRAYQLGERPSNLSISSSWTEGGVMDPASELAASVELFAPKDCAKFLDTMKAVREKCAALHRVPLYHYTSPFVAPLILKGGLLMSSQGQGDGGVYFSTLGPASYGVGSKKYEDNIITDCFGAERLHEYRGKNKLGACLVYAVEPSVVQQAPGGRDNAKMVSKGLFADISMPHANGNYYLRPDRIMAAFLLDPARPPLGFEEFESQLEAEKGWDLEVKESLAPVGALPHLHGGTQGRAQIRVGSGNAAVITSTTEGRSMAVRGGGGAEDLGRGTLVATDEVKCDIINPMLMLPLSHAELPLSGARRGKGGGEALASDV